MKNKALLQKLHKAIGEKNKLFGGLFDEYKEGYFDKRYGKYDSESYHAYISTVFFLLLDRDYDEFYNHPDYRSGSANFFIPDQVGNAIYYKAENKTFSQWIKDIKAAYLQPRVKTEKTKRPKL